MAAVAAQSQPQFIISTGDNFYPSASTHLNCFKILSAGRSRIDKSAVQMPSDDCVDCFVSATAFVDGRISHSQNARGPCCDPPSAVPTLPQ